MTPTPASGQGRSVRCDGCGGVILLVTLDARATCSFCRHEQAVPPALLAELSRYQAGVDEHRARIASHDSAELSERREILSDPFGVGAMIVAFGPILVFGGGNEIAKLIHLLPLDTQRTVDAVVEGGTGVWFAAGTAGYLHYRNKGAKRRVRAFTTGALGVASCPSCGAPNAFVDGKVIERCAYCGAGLVAHADVLRRGLDAARLMERRARLDRLRTERSAAGTILSPAQDGVIQAGLYVLLGAFALAGGHFLPILFVDGKGPLASYRELISTGAWWLGVLGAIAAVVVIVRLFTKRSDWQVAHAALASKLGAERVGVAAARSWLDTYWAGPFDGYDLGLSLFGAFLTTKVDGFPVLLLLDTGTNREDRAPRMALFVAASFPSAPPPVSAPLRGKLGDHDFAVENTEGGLYAHAGSDIIQRLHARPMDILGLLPLPGMMTAWLKREGEPAPPP